MVEAQVSQEKVAKERLPSVGNGADISSPSRGVQDHLGRVLNLEFKVWNLRWDLEGQRLLHLKGNKMDVYVASNLPRMEGVANRWTRA